jgi:hypothetical protein
MSDLSTLPQMDGMMQTLERLARDPQIPTERITELFRLAEKRELAMMRRIYFTDMNAMQMELTQITRDRHNPAFHSKYATEAAIDAAARPIYTKYGFSITYGTAPAIVPGNILVTCTVAHRSGFAETHSLEAPAVPANRGVTQLQAVGGTVTYLKRTLVKMVLALVTADNPEDNDGNGIVEPPAKSEPNYAEIVAQFEAAAERIKDSDEARTLLEWKPGVIALTALPHGDARQHYMVLRSLVQRKWLSKPDDGSSASEDIEGL